MTIDDYKKHILQVLDGGREATMAGFVAALSEDARVSDRILHALYRAAIELIADDQIEAFRPVPHRIRILYRVKEVGG